MVFSCSVMGCGNKYKKKTENGDQKYIQFHKFPMSRPEILKQWIHATKRLNWKPSTCSFICSEHFENNAYQKKRLANRKLLKKNAIPSIFNKLPDHLEVKMIRRTLKRNFDLALNLDEDHDINLDVNIEQENDISFNFLQSTPPTTTFTSILDPLTALETSENTSLSSSSINKQLVDKEIQCDGGTPSPKVTDLRKKVEVLQQQLETRENKIKILKDQIKRLEPIGNVNDERLKDGARHITKTVYFYSPQTNEMTQSPYNSN